MLDLGGVWTKTLHYLEQSVAHWVMSRRRAGGDGAGGRCRQHRQALARSSWPTTPRRSTAWCCRAATTSRPESYGEAPMHPDWHGDRVRDRYEMELVDAFIEAGKPVFGICRGLQLLNVLHGGTLLQDIATQRPDSLAHRDTPRFERHFHEIELVGGYAAGAAVPGCRPRAGQQHPPPGHQGPGAGLRRRGALPRRRLDRSHPQARAGLRGRGAMAPRVPRHRARHLRRHARC